MSDGEQAARIIDKLIEITDALDVTNRKKAQIKRWLYKLYTHLDI